MHNEDKSSSSPRSGGNAEEGGTTRTVEEETPERLKYGPSENDNCVAKMGMEAANPVYRNRLGARTSLPCPSTMALLIASSRYSLRRASIGSSLAALSAGK